MTLADEDRDPTTPAALFSLAELDVAMDLEKPFLTFVEHRSHVSVLRFFLDERRFKELGSHRRRPHHGL